MFTGIVQSVGTVAAVEQRGGDLRLEIDVGNLATSSRHHNLGDSIAVNGVCLTVIEMRGRIFAFDISVETLDRTLLREFKKNDLINLEPALTSADALGGHLVSGHIDGVGELLALTSDARSTRMTFLAPVQLARFIAEKGSICIDGVSLTVNGVTDTESGAEFGINIVPHTFENTNFKNYKKDTRVHLEVDQIARYIERMLNCNHSSLQTKT